MSTTAGTTSEAEEQTKALELYRKKANDKKDLDAT